MLAGVMERIICCLTGRSANVVVPIETSEPVDGFEFVEVKPGRVIRVRHIIPDRQVVENHGSHAGSIPCKRKISVYRNGQLYIENLSDAVCSEPPNCQNGDPEPNSTVEVELTDCNSTAPDDSRPNQEGAVVQQPQAAQRKRRKPKRTVVIDCERKITSCKGTHADVVLFFIHGVGGSLDIWGNQLDFFSHLGYEVVAPDLAGHGASSVPQVSAAYTFYALAEDVRAIFKRYARKRNILVGHSYGVSFCTFLAHEYPEDVHKMVMINGVGPLLWSPASVQSSTSQPLCCTVYHHAYPGAFSTGFAHQTAKEKQLLKESNAFNVSSFVLRAMMSGQYWPEGDEVYHAEITVPTLLVHGMYDKFVPVEEDQRMAEILILAFLKIINEGSHMVMMECPDTVNTLLHEFFLWQPNAPRKPKQEAKPLPDNTSVSNGDTKPSAETKSKTKNK